MLRNLVEDTRTALARGGLQLIFLAYQAAEMAHAVVVTLVRVVFTHRKMLEWQPAAATARAAGSSTRGPRAFVEQMLASPVLAVLTLIVVAISRPGALAGKRHSALWTIAPFVAWRFGRRRPQRPPLSEIDAKYLKASRELVEFFEDHVGEVDHWLPPDNCQNTPDALVAHRTSPTNIGMCLLATLAAHDFEFIDTGTLLDRCEHAMNASNRSSASRASPQLVRLVEPGAAQPATSPRWTAAISPPRSSRWPRPAAAPSGRQARHDRQDARWRRVFSARHELQDALRRAARSAVDRLPPGRRRGTRPPRQRLLRPARHRSARRELRRNRQGRYPRFALVLPRLPDD
jgi:hypothetical protein